MAINDMLLQALLAARKAARQSGATHGELESAPAETGLPPGGLPISDPTEEDQLQRAGMAPTSPGNDILGSGVLRALAERAKNMPWSEYGNRLVNMPKADMSGMPLHPKAAGFGIKPDQDAAAIPRPDVQQSAPRASMPSLLAALTPEQYSQATEQAGADIAAAKAQGKQDWERSSLGRMAKGNTDAFRTAREESDLTFKFPEDIRLEKDRQRQKAITANMNARDAKQRAVYDAIRGRSVSFRDPYESNGQDLATQLREIAAKNRNADEAAAEGKQMPFIGLRASPGSLAARREELKTPTATDTARRELAASPLHQAYLARHAAPQLPGLADRQKMVAENARLGRAGRRQVALLDAINQRSGGDSVLGDLLLGGKEFAQTRSNERIGLREAVSREKVAQITADAQKAVAEGKMPTDPEHIFAYFVGKGIPPAAASEAVKAMQRLRPSTGPAVAQAPGSSPSVVDRVSGLGEYSDLLGAIGLGTKNPPTARDVVMALRTKAKALSPEDWNRLKRYVAEVTTLDPKWGKSFFGSPGAQMAKYFASTASPDFKTYLDHMMAMSDARPL